MAQQAQGKTFHYRNYRLFRNATLGTGAYGQVCRAKLDELPCAAKLLHPILVDRSDPKNQTNLRKFEQECRFLSEIRHPNIVQYLDMVYDGPTGLPVLLMELMDESLTHFLERSDTPLSYHVQVDISHDIALALAYLHSNDIIHRDLSSNNVLLIGPGHRAKVTDFGMSKFTEMHPHMTPLTKCPGTQAYMAPEALQEEPLYTAKLDVFQAGVLMVQIITRKFPNPTRANRRISDSQYPTGVILVPVPEIQRRHDHLSLITDSHSMVGLIRNCLKDEEKDRPTAQQLCQQLSNLKDVARYSESRQEGEEGVGRGDGSVRERVMEVEQREQEVGGRLGELDVREREVEGREQEVGGRLGELDVREREVEGREREVEGRLEEVGIREREVERRESEVGERLQVKDQELQREREEKERLSKRLDMANVQGQHMQERHRQVQSQLRDEEENGIVHELPSQSVAMVYTCQVSGPGLRSATVNYSTHVTVELRDQSGQLCLVPQRISAELEYFALQQSKFRNKTTQKKQPQNVPINIAPVSPSQYKISFTAVTGGQHKLHIQNNDSEIDGSPFTITVYPTQLGTPTLVRVVTGVSEPYCLAINSRGDMIVSECSGHRVSVLESAGKVIRRFGSEGDRPEQMIYPTGVAVDRDDNVYVTSEHKLQKFSRDGRLIKTVGRRGNKEGEFNVPRGVRLHNGQVYVCDKDNHCIQMFDYELNFIRTIGSRLLGKEDFNKPYDLDFDAKGNTYVADYGSNRIQVLDASGQFIRRFGHEEGEGRLEEPTAVHIIGQIVYVSDNHHHRIAVYETSGQFVTSFGREGEGEGEFMSPRHITSDRNGFLYVCDWLNDRIKILDNRI